MRGYAVLRTDHHVTATGHVKQPNSLCSNRFRLTEASALGSLWVPTGCFRTHLGEGHTGFGEHVAGELAAGLAEHDVGIVSGGAIVL